MKASGYLKASWVRQQIAHGAPLLPAHAALAVWYSEKLLAAIGVGGQELTAETPGVRSFPLMLEHVMLGVVLVQVPPDNPAIEAWGEALRHGLQGLIDAQHARYSVTQEALDSYREMALLQRAVCELNQSLKPAAVAASLLREFQAGKVATDFGVVYLLNAEGGYTVTGTFGEGAEATSVALKSSALFVSMALHTQGDIVNDLARSPLNLDGVVDLKSLLWLPLSAHDEHLGLLVLATRHPDGFSAADMKRARLLVSVASSALRNAQLYEAEQAMFQSFVQVIATAIDAKSPFTAGHCRRVPEIALMLADKAHQAQHGPFAEFTLDEDERKALEIAALLHDCGKMITPEWVIDKSSKLESINDRLEAVALRFEVLRRDAQLDYCRAAAAGDPNAESLCQQRLHQLDDDFALLERCNTGAESVTPAQIERIHAIAAMTWRRLDGAELPLLSDSEVYNLSVQRGTLNPEERLLIEDHAVYTIRMLSQIPFPHALRNVAEYAAGHHERIDGHGYPHGLKREQLSIPARIMAIADIFEALTAPDRPYRKAGSLQWAIEVMQGMKDEGHIDGDLFDLFLSENVHLAYAEKHLSLSSCDGADPARKQS